MAHSRAKVLMPVGAVEGVPLRGEETCPGNAREFIIVSIREKITIAHMFCRHFIQDAEFTLRGFGGETGHVARTVRDSGAYGCLE